LQEGNNTLKFGGWLLLRQIFSADPLYLRVQDPCGQS
jgi:hypothetical protein